MHRTDSDRPDVAPALEACPPDGTVLSYLGRSLSGEELRAFEDHLGRCRRCRDLVRLVASRGDSVPVASARGVVVPGVLGRFRIERPLGAGAFGSVWKAHDPRIDRDVALKVYDQQRVEATSTREAQALGRLTHPNVVTVYELGEDDGRAYLAMEWVDGEDLRSWPRADRTWRAVLEVLLQAGRGLQALHAAGVLHRDIKPANVIVARDGGARVVDLGLATIAPRWQQSSSDPSSTGATEVTRASTVAGSPAYMAPELWRGGTANVRSEVFSYATLLFECLYGVRPFVGDTAEALLAAMEDGRVVVRRGLRVVPGWLRTAILRGLNPAPLERWPSIAAMLRVLETGLARRRRWRSVAAGTAVTVTAFAAVVPPLLRARTRAECQAGAEEMSQYWDEERAAALTAILSEIHSPHAPQTAARVSQRLSEYAGDWRAARLQLCAGPSPDVATTDAPALACFGRRIAKFESVAAVLRHADVDVLDRADEALAELRAPARCLEPDGAEPAPDDDPNIQRALEEIATLRAAGLAEAARAGALSLRDGLSADAPAGTRARVLLAYGSAQRALGARAAAMEALQEALSLALAARDWPLVQSIAALCISGTDDVDVGLVYAHLARSLLPPTGGLQASVVIEGNVGKLLLQAERFEEGTRALTTALELAEAAYGPGDLQLARLHHNLGTALLDRGDAQHALEQHNTAFEIVRDALGPQHRDLGAHHSALATALIMLGRLSEADEHLAEGIAIETGYATQSDRLSILLNERGTLQGQRGDAAAAAATLARSVEMKVALFGRRDRRVGVGLSNLANAQRLGGDLARARATIDDALDILGGIEGAGLERASAHGTKASIAASAGDAATALEEDLRALELRRAILGDTHPAVARAQNNIGDTLIKLKRFPEAVAYLEPSYAQRSGQTTDAGDRAATAFSLALALAEAGGDLERADRLALEARAALVESAADPAYIAEIDAWRASHAAKLSARRKRAAASASSSSRAAATSARDTATGRSR